MAQFRHESSQRGVDGTPEWVSPVPRESEVTI